jgi:PAS domain S-box-containing protein
MAEELVLSTMRHGAADYLLKSNLARLGAVVERELGSAAVRRVQRRRQHALLDRELLSRALLDNLPDPLVVVSDDGRIELFNHAAERLLGYSAGEVLGSAFTSLFDAPLPEQDGRLAGPTVGRRKSGEPVPLELAVGTTRPGDRLFRAVLLRPMPSAPTTLDCP